MRLVVKEIVLQKVAVHNLKNVDLTLSAGELIVFTGVSGSGKSSLAFDTIYVEGQRRYIESLSTSARRQIGELARPQAEKVEGIAPTIAVEQKTVGKNPRSTVGTLTGIYDHLRVLFARIATPHCPESGEAVGAQSEEQMIRAILAMPEGSKVIVCAPHTQGKKGELKEEFAELLRAGFSRIRLDGEVIDLDETVAVNPDKAHDIDYVIDRLVIDIHAMGRVKEAVSHGLELGKGVLSVINMTTKTETLFAKDGYAKKSGLSYPPLEPHDFSFNHPIGMCSACEGLGRSLEFDLEKIIDPELSIAEDCCSIAGSYKTVRWGNVYDNLARLYNFSVDTPWKDLSKSAKKLFLEGSRKKWIRMQFTHPVKGTTWTDYVKWRGVIYDAKKRLSEAKSESYRSKMAQVMVEGLCSSCNGARIKPYPAAAKLGGVTIHELTQMTIKEAHDFFTKLKLTKEQEVIGGELIKEITQRLLFLLNVGLHYMTIERTAPTLSGGEGQRVRLASHIGSGLVGAIYVLDEPSIGLHARDNKKLIETLGTLRDQGNTVIVVEHDEETIYAADTVVDVGPGAGVEGGEIVAIGSPEDVMASERSITGAYLSRKKQIPIPKKRRKGNGHLIVKGAEHHNLKNVTAKIPLETLTAITGVSGSGKSSLILDTLFPALANDLHRAAHTVGKHAAIEGIDLLDKVIGIDQSPIGRTPRSNPGTYIKLFDDIRALFAQLPESRALGFEAGRFSFNVKEGSCLHCGGMGQTKVDMDFMEDVWVECNVCMGKRFDPKTLSVTFKEKNIHDVLTMPVSEAAAFFADIPHIAHKLSILERVGLGYIEIGQSSTTLSGGEAQRIKLAKELVRPATGRTLYILDEPTTGLHFEDINKLVAILQELVDAGNSVLVIEHNLDLIKTADWIIDMGPDGGKGGGKIVAEGTPEAIAKKETPTSLALRETHTHKEKLAKKEEPIRQLTVQGATQNTLKDVSVEIPLGKITAFCGPSGSGKSSLAFETIYAEGQRRYSETLSLYARQYVKQMPKPRVGAIEGLSPAIAIEQKHHAGNPRSTVGTMTEVYDYLRVLYARAGIAYCPETGEKIETISPQFVVSKLMELPEKTKLFILAPTNNPDFEEIQKQGYLRIRLNGKYFELDEEIPFDSNRKNEVEIVVDRLIVKPGIEPRLLEAIEKAAFLSQGLFLVATPEEDRLFNLAFAVASTGKSYRPLIPQSFSYNATEGMCPDCLGLGFQYGASLSNEPDITKLTPLELMLDLWKENATDSSYRIFLAFLSAHKIDRDTPIEKLPPKKRQLLFNGDDKPFSWNGFSMVFRGIHETLARLGKVGARDVKKTILPLLDKKACSACSGSRLKPLARLVEVSGVTLPALTDMSIDEAKNFFDRLQLDMPELDETVRQVQSRLAFLCTIGLDYLSLSRSAPTLSGGETQRICLARQLGSGLTGCLYVLDEPTIGLHPTNTARLLDALKRLRDLGNTLLLVEHDPDTLAIADKIVDFGPAAGTYGGEIIATGTLDEIKNNPDSLTGAYLSGKKTIAPPEKKRKAENHITIKKARLHNLNIPKVDIPLGVLTCVTGVSGSGKSSLINGLLAPATANFLRTKNNEYLGSQFEGLEQIQQLINLDQNPIGHTSRADISTYTDLLTPIRQFFAQLPAAKAKGLMPRHFSFNHLRGMCKSCFGLGHKNIELQFLPPIRVTCEACAGNRLNPNSLTVTYKGKNLGQILKLTVTQAVDFLPHHPKMIKILAALKDVGLDYLTLGQAIASLSGGEAQRLRLSRELARRSRGKTLYIFDEPTIGLHDNDIAKLIPIFHSLVDRGHTLIIIEHNPHIIAQADHIINLGPGAGIHGGKLLT